MRRTLTLSLWLPIGVLVASLLRFDLQPSMLFSLPAMILGLVMAWPGGIPLTLALRLLHHHSRPLAYGCAAVLCPLSVGAATVGGLFGPIGIWIYTAIISLPAWLVLWLVTRLRRWRTPADSGQSSSASTG